MLDAYTAGLVDADGSIIISRVNWKGENGHKRPDHRVAVQVTNTHRPVLEQLVEEYGGSIANKPMTKGSFFTRRKHYNWSVAGVRAVSMLERLRPYLIIKADQAWMACEFWASKTRPKYMRAGLSAEELALREGYYLAMKSLKGTEGIDGAHVLRPETV